jgi:predicted Zn-dependent peptidase
MDLSTHTLPNGLTVASVRLPGFRTAAIAAFVRAGSRNEPARLNGLAHFLEHMAFKGTSSRDARAIAIAIERVGAQMNAYTAKDHTAYHTVLLSEHTDVALEVLADVLRRSTFPPDEIERERGVILQELADAADDPEGVAQDEFDLRAFPRQAFGRPILGSPRAVRAVSRDDCIAYQQTHYTGCNMVVVGVGGIEHSPFLDQVARHFGDLPRGAPVPSDPVRYVGGYRHVDDDYEQTSIALGWPIPARADPNYPVFEMLGDLLGGGMSSPLFQSVREQRGLAYAVDAYAEGHEDCGTLLVTAGVAPRNLRLFFDVACEQIAALTDRIEPDDLERARNQYRTHLARRLERPLALAESIARDLFLHGRVVPIDEILYRSQQIDDAALRAAATEMLRAKPTLVLVGRAGRGDHHEAVRRRLAR